MSGVEKALERIETQTKDIQTTLKGKPGEPGMEEAVRDNTDNIKKMKPHVDHYANLRQKAEGAKWMFKAMPYLVAGTIVCVVLFFIFIGQTTLKTQQAITEVQQIVKNGNGHVTRATPTPGP